MIEDIELFMKDVPSFEMFQQDKKTLNAVITSLTQIGEICGHMSKFYPDALELPYRDIVGMRTILVHMYHKINIIMIWKVIHSEVPALKAIIQEYKNTHPL
jgi:uncharacterized protein with HEPN domain